MLCNIVLIVQEAEHKKKKENDSEKKGKDSENQKGARTEQVKNFVLVFLALPISLRE
jgi:hypothetical protein